MVWGVVDVRTVWLSVSIPVRATALIELSLHAILHICSDFVRFLFS